MLYCRLSRSDWQYLYMAGGIFIKLELLGPVYTDPNKLTCTVPWYFPGPLFPSRGTHASRSPRFRLCSPKMRQKLRLFCRLAHLPSPAKLSRLILFPPSLVRIAYFAYVGVRIELNFA